MGCPCGWPAGGMVMLSLWHAHDSCLVSLHCCRNPSVVKSCEAKSPTQSHVSSRYWLTAWLLNSLGLSFGSSHHSALAFVLCHVFYSFSCNLLCLSLHKVWRCHVRGLFHGNSPLLTWTSQMLTMLEPALKPSMCVWVRDTGLAALCHAGGTFWNIFLQQFQGDPANRWSFHCPASAEIKKQKQKLSEEFAAGIREVILLPMQLQWVRKKGERSLVQ